MSVRQHRVYEVGWTSRANLLPYHI